MCPTLWLIWDEGSSPPSNTHTHTHTHTTIETEKKEFVFTSKGVRSQASVFPLSWDHISIQIEASAQAPGVFPIVFVQTVSRVSALEMWRGRRQICRSILATMFTWERNSLELRIHVYWEIYTYSLFTIAMYTSTWSKWWSPQRCGRMTDWRRVCMSGTRIKNQCTTHPLCGSIGLQVRAQ